MLFHFIEERRVEGDSKRIKAKQRLSMIKEIKIWGFFPTTVSEYT